MPFDDRIHAGRVTYPRIDGQEGTSEVYLLHDGLVWETADPLLPELIDVLGISVIAPVHLGTPGLRELRELAEAMGGALQTADLAPDPDEVY
jgi:hypothetical protein